MIYILESIQLSAAFLHGVSIKLHPTDNTWQTASAHFHKRCAYQTFLVHFYLLSLLFRLDALAKALSVIATATWLGGWLGVRHTPVLYQNG